MSASPNYASTPTVGAALLTTADTSRTAPTSGGSAVFSPGASGGLCERVVIMPLATVTATVLRLFRYDGTTAHLYAEVTMPALIVAAGTKVPGTVLSAVSNPELFPIAIPANWSLRATINDVQTGIKVQAEGGAF